MTTEPEECAVKWCNETGEHSVHRLYLTSLCAWRGSWLLGVNTVQANHDTPHVELTASTKQGRPAIVPLDPAEAKTVGRALIEAASRATR
ncbi:hypothetical protein [Jiangella asiatica]|uniref:Uncharacterized protein n=1 Tax=Jiangella asiatica TaxID=2530372 RepID=A0A4R5DN62_9ACTN|nr:hypothetical protein [Jiangella asiatica]TDE13510.1 hypothetical protein E1269_05625 [Jiangella asiatica]